MVSPLSLVFLVSGSWLQKQQQIWAPSHTVNFKSNKKLVGYFHKLVVLLLHNENLFVLSYSFMHTKKSGRTLDLMLWCKKKRSIWGSCVQLTSQKSTNYQNYYCEAYFVFLGDQQRQWGIPLQCPHSSHLCSLISFLHNRLLILKGVWYNNESSFLTSYCVWFFCVTQSSRSIALVFSCLLWITEYHFGPN